MPVLQEHGLILLDPFIQMESWDEMASKFWS